MCAATMARSAGKAGPIRVQLVDDQRLMRDGLHALLELQEDVAVVGEAADGREAVAVALELRPDVVVMDLRMPVMDGVEATSELTRRLPSARVLVLTTFDDDEYVFAALDAGAAGYVLKDVPAAELAAAIRTVHSGGMHLGGSVAAKVVAELSRSAHARRATAGGVAQGIPYLTPRELDVLRLIGLGASNSEIAAQLVISEGTVKNHVSNLLGRLGLRDRTQAALYAREHGLI
jgi:DNA-binding NarL/FixJ family response regulator